MHSEVQTLNLERRSLLAAVAELHSLIPAGALASRLAQKESGQNLLNLASLSELKLETDSSSTVKDSRNSSEMSSASRLAQPTSDTGVTSGYRDRGVHESSSSSSMASLSSVHSSSSLQSVDNAQNSKTDKRVSNR